MRLRKYESRDCEHLAELFYRTVHSVNTKDYTTEQLNARAPGTVDLKEWNRSFLEHRTVVTIKNNEKVFSDFSAVGQKQRSRTERMPTAMPAHCFAVSFSRKKITPARVVRASPPPFTTGKNTALSTTPER